MIALVYDLKAYRVPNWLIVAGWILGIICRTLAGGLEGSIWWIVGVGVIGIFFIPFALLHMFGAGDVKLFMVTGGFFGVSFTIQYAVVALFCGAVFSVGKMLWHRNLLDRKLSQCSNVRKRMDFLWKSQRKRYRGSHTFRTSYGSRLWDRGISHVEVWFYRCVVKYRKEKI